MWGNSEHVTSNLTCYLTCFVKICKTLTQKSWLLFCPQLWDPEERIGVHLRHGRLQLHKLWAGPEQEDPQPAQGWNYSTAFLHIHIKCFLYLYMHSKSWTKAKIWENEMHAPKKQTENVNLGPSYCKYYYIYQREAGWVFCHCWKWFTPFQSQADLHYCWVISFIQ